MPFERNANAKWNPCAAFPRRTQSSEYLKLTRFDYSHMEKEKHSVSSLCSERKPAVGTNRVSTISHVTYQSIAQWYSAWSWLVQIKRASLYETNGEVRLQIAKDMPHLEDQRSWTGKITKPLQTTCTHQRTNQKNKIYGEQKSVRFLTPDVHCRWADQKAIYFVGN